MTTSTIRVMTGNDSYRSGRATVAAQMMTSRAFPENADGRRAFYLTDLHRMGLFGVQRVGQQQRLPGAINGNGDLGVWWDASYVVPDGMIIMIQLEVNDRANAFSDKGRVLIRTRANGPLWRLSARRIQDPLANTNVNPVIEGRFDFITLAEAAAAGCAVASTNPAVNRLYNMSTWSRMIDYAKLTEGQAAPRVQTERITVGGKTQEVSTATKSRRINLD